MNVDSAVSRLGRGSSGGSTVMVAADPAADQVVGFLEAQPGVCFFILPNNSVLYLHTSVHSFMPNQAPTVSVFQN